MTEHLKSSTKQAEEVHTSPAVAEGEYKQLVEAAEFARNRLLQDSGDQESIDVLNRALASLAPPVDEQEEVQEQENHSVNGAKSPAVPRTESKATPELKATPHPNLIGHYVVKIYAHDDCPAEDRKRLRNAFNGLHDEVESVFSVQVEGEDWEYDIQYEVTNEMPWEPADEMTKAHATSDQGITTEPKIGQASLNESPLSPTQAEPGDAVERTLDETCRVCNVPIFRECQPRWKNDTLPHSYAVRLHEASPLSAEQG